MKKIIALITMFCGISLFADSPVTTTYVGEVGEDNFCYYSRQNIKDILKKKCLEETGEELDEYLGTTIKILGDTCEVTVRGFCNT